MVKASGVGKNRYARERKSVLLQPTCWRCVLASNVSALRWLEVFQGCCFNIFQTELPSLPASCMFYLISNAGLGLICVALLVA